MKYSGDGPFDTEDLALSQDGKTLWIADTGDNVTSRERRTRVAVWTMPVRRSSQPVLHRLSYPERKPHDAEALLIGVDGLPLVITKVPSGKAEIYTPAAARSGGNTEPVPMKKVGEITLPKTTTDNPLNIIGRVGHHRRGPLARRQQVVLRTYADAFEYDVSGDDIVPRSRPASPGSPRWPTRSARPSVHPGRQAVRHRLRRGGSPRRTRSTILSYTPSPLTAPSGAGAAGASRRPTRPGTSGSPGRDHATWSPRSGWSAWCGRGRHRRDRPGAAERPAPPAAAGEDVATTASRPAPRRCRRAPAGGGGRPSAGGRRRRPAAGDAAGGRGGAPPDGRGGAPAGGRGGGPADGRGGSRRAGVVVAGRWARWSVGRPWRCSRWGARRCSGWWRGAGPAGGRGGAPAGGAVSTAVDGPTAAARGRPPRAAFRSGAVTAALMTGGAAHRRPQRRTLPNHRRGARRPSPRIPRPRGTAIATNGYPRGGR